MTLGPIATVEASGYSLPGPIAFVKVSTISLAFNSGDTKSKDHHIQTIHVEAADSQEVLIYTVTPIW